MSEQELINAAKAQLEAYNKKDWDAARAAITADFVYEEIGTQRKIEGCEQVIAAWQSWGATSGIKPIAVTIHPNGFMRLITFPIKVAYGSTDPL